MPVEPAAVPLPAMPVAAPPVTVGSILGRTFSTWWKRMWSFAAATLVVMVPLYALQIALLATAFRGYAPDGMKPLGGWLDALVPIGMGVLWIFALMVLACGHTYGAVLHLGGKPVRLRTMLAVAPGRILALAGLVLVGSAAYLAIVLVGAVAAFLSELVGGFVTGLVLVPILVPTACVVLTALSLTIPVVVAERTGPLGGLRRSWVLTRGRRRALFLSLLVMSLVMLAFLFVQFFLTGLTMAATMRLAEPNSSSTGFTIVAVAGVTALALILVAPLVTLVPAVAYHDLRIEKEGVSTDELARVFQ